MCLIMASVMKMPHLLVFDFQRGEARLQLLTPLEQLAFQGLLRAHHSHLHPHTAHRDERDGLRLQHHKNMLSCPGERT